MNTSLRLAFQQRKAVAGAVLLLAGFVIGYDLYTTASVGSNSNWTFRLAVIVSVIPLYKLSTGASWQTLGFKIKPTMGWPWWCRVTLILAATLFVVLLVSFGVFHLLGQEFPRHVRPTLGWRTFHFIFTYPIGEEWLYRFLVCLPLVALVGTWPTLLISGTLFAGLHIAYGIPSPDNLLAGFILTWAFFRSETILVPIILHVLGNAAAVGLAFLV